MGITLAYAKMALVDLSLDLVKIKPSGAILFCSKPANRAADV